SSPRRGEMSIARPGRIARSVGAERFFVALLWSEESKACRWSYKHLAPPEPCKNELAQVLRGQRTQRIFLRLDQILLKFVGQSKAALAFDHLTLAGVPESEHFLFTLRLNSCSQCRLSFGGLLSKPLEGCLRSLGNGSERQALTHRFLDADLRKPYLVASWRDPDRHVRPWPDAVRGQKVSIHPGEVRVRLRHLLNAVK